jgi:L-tyrosine isonitrile synthase
MSMGMQRGLTAVNDRLRSEKRSNERTDSVSKHNYNSFFRFPTPESVLKTFNTRAFKREQPDKPELMLQLASEAIARNAPLSFIMYWGKGPRAHLGAPELTCLDFIASMTARIRQCHGAGARLSLVFTDTHAEINGHSPQSIAAYFEELTGCARHRGFDTHLLSGLVRSCDLPAPPEAFADSVPDELFEALRVSATKWFRGEGTSEQGALRYYRANMVEKKVVERAFPRSIFVTFNGSEMQPLFPDALPIFYMYSLRHGVCAKPWFLPSDFIYHPSSATAEQIEALRGA